MLTYNGKPIKNPLFQACALVVVVGGITFVALFIAAFPLWLPAHFVLKAMGRKAILRGDSGGISVVLDRTSFERA